MPTVTAERTMMASTLLFYDSETLNIPSLFMFNMSLLLLLTTYPFLGASLTSRPRLVGPRQRDVVSAGDSTHGQGHGRIAVVKLVRVRWAKEEMRQRWTNA